MIVNPTTFAPAYVAWWRQLQPPWRTRVSGTLSQDVPETEDWANLAKGGTAGIYTVVVALSWWIRALGTASDTTEVLLMVQDLLWVLQRLRQPHDVVPSLKRVRTEESDVQLAGRGKRYDHQLSNLL